MRRRKLATKLDEPSTIENVTLIDYEMGNALEKSGFPGATLASEDYDVTLVDKKINSFKDRPAISETGDITQFKQWDGHEDQRKTAGVAVFST